MIRLKKLKAKACRGILDGPDLDFGRDGLILAGDNGTGKSSYIDALEKVLTGKCGSLDTGDQGLGWSKQGKHVASNLPPQIELIVGNSSKDFSITVGAASPCTAPIKSMLIAACRQSFLLRRRTLLAFINAKPADRYRAVADFLRLERFNDFEAKVKALETNCQQQISANRSTKQIEEIGLRQQLSLASSASVDEATCLESVNTTLADAGLAAIANTGEIPDRIRRVDAQLRAFGQIEEVQKLQVLKTLIAELPSLNELAHIAGSYHRAREMTLTEESKLTGTFYQQVLEEGAKWIRADSLDECPLCENAIDATCVLERVQERLDQHRELFELRTLQDSARTNLVSAIRNALRALMLVKSKWSEAFGADLPSSVLTFIDSLNEVATTHAALAELSLIEKHAGELMATSSAGFLESILANIDLELKKYPRTDAYDRLAKARAALQATNIHWEKIVTANAEISESKMRVCRFKGSGNWRRKREKERCKPC